MFVLRQVAERACDRRCNVYIAFLDLGKAYHCIDREGLWKVLRMYGVGGKLRSGIKSLCK